MYFTYVLICGDSKLYVGFTEDIERRFAEHASRNVTATKNRQPVKLVYYEACLSKTAALQRENYFKTGFGRKFLKNRTSE